MWTKLLESGTAESKASIAKTLKHWQEDSDLAGVRDDRAIEALAEPERAALCRPSAGVATLLDPTYAALTQRSSRCRLRLPSRGVRTALGEALPIILPSRQPKSPRIASSSPSPLGTAGLGLLA